MGATEMTLFPQTLMPLWKVVLFENLEVGALLDEYRRRVAVKPHSNLAPTVAAVGQKRTLLDRVESV